jgi:hypothetical protein
MNVCTRGPFFLSQDAARQLLIQESVDGADRGVAYKACEADPDARLRHEPGDQDGGEQGVAA